MRLPKDHQYVRDRRGGAYATPKIFTLGFGAGGKALTVRGYRQAPALRSRTDCLNESDAISKDAYSNRLAK
jgi:hypothetical protein